MQITDVRIRKVEKEGKMKAVVFMFCLLFLRKSGDITNVISAI